MVMEKATVQRPPFSLFFLTDNNDGRIAKFLYVKVLRRSLVLALLTGFVIC